MKITMYAITLGYLVSLALLPGCVLFGGDKGSTPSNNGQEHQNNPQQTPENGPAGNSANAPASPHPQARSPQSTVNPDDAKMSTVLAAKSRGDYAFLEKVCRRKVNYTHTVDKACSFWIGDLKKRRDGKALVALCSERPRPIPSGAYMVACRNVSQYSRGNWAAKLANCSTLAADYETQMKKHRHGNSWPIHRTAAQSAVRCKNWNFFFDTLMIKRGGQKGARTWGFRLLKHFAKSNVDILAGLEIYLKTNRAPFSVKYGCLAAVHLRTWLNFYKRFKMANTFIKYMKKATMCARTQFARYFYYAKCKNRNAVKFFYNQLISKDPKAKATACRYLGDFGKRKHFRRMRIIARTDATYRVRGLTRVYWVRDICKAAIGRIKLRH